MDIVEKFVHCSLCRQRYTSPRQLPCCHSFCEQCLATYVAGFLGQRILPCPTCGFEVNTSSDITEGLPSSFPSGDFENDLLLINKSTDSSRGNDVTSQCACGASNVGFFCFSCNVTKCHECCGQKHSSCNTSKLNENFSSLCSHQRLKCSQAMLSIKQELSNVHDSLLPKERQLLMKKEETALGISKYFSDLRHKVTQFLIAQEQKVQHDLDNLVMLEKLHLKSDLKQCSAMLESVEMKQNAIINSVNKIEEGKLNMIHLKLVSSLQREVEQHEKIASEMRAESPDARFIINTELEDAMTNTELIKIEVTNTRQYDSQQDYILSGDDGPVAEPENDAGANSEHPAVETQPVANTDTGNSQREVSNRLNLPEEPPPPYPGRSIDSASIAQPVITIEQSSVDHKLEVGTTENKNNRNRTQFQHFRPIPSAPPASLDDVIDNLVVESNSDQLYPTIDANPPRTPSPRFERGNGENTLRNSGRRSDNALPSPQPPRRHPQQISHRDTKSRRSRELTRFELKHIWQANTMAVGELKAPRIFGMVWLQNEYLLVGDRWNNRLKVIKDAMIVHVFSLGQYQPWDIAEMPNNYSAVAVPECKMIYVVIFEVPNLTIRKKISTKRGYSCLTYNAESRRFFGATVQQFSTPGVDIVGIDGTQIATIMPSMTGRSFLSYPRGLTVTENKLAITDFQKKTVIFVKLDERGVILNKYQGTESYPIREPNGIALNSRDRYMMILDTRSGKIHVVSPSGHLIGMVVTELDHDEPCKACIDTTLSPPRLAVAYGNGMVASYDIRKY